MEKSNVDFFPARKRVGDEIDRFLVVGREIMRQQYT
jgi:hypothetical protein